MMARRSTLRFVALTTAAVVVFAAAACWGPAFAQSAQPRTGTDPCAGSRDVRLTNGRIHTMDARSSVVQEVTIQNGRFTAVGRAVGQRLSPCTRTIDLRGRTA